MLDMAFHILFPHTDTELCLSTQLHTRLTFCQQPGIGNPSGPCWEESSGEEEQPWGLKLVVKVTTEHTTKCSVLDFMREMYNPR